MRHLEIKIEIFFAKLMYFLHYPKINIAKSR